MRPARAAGALAAVLAVASMATACTDSRPMAREGTPAPDELEVLVAFGLRRDDAALARFVETSATADGDRGPARLTPAELRERFGATPDTVRDAIDRLEAIGIDEVELDATGAVLTASVTSAQARTALDAPLVEQERPDHSTVVVPERDPDVPTPLEGPITEVVGLTGTVRPAASAALGPSVDVVDPGCASADLASAADVEAANRHVGTQSLYDAGADGDGVTIALWAVGQFDPAPLSAFEQCRQSPVVVPDLVDVALTPPAPTGSEVTLDVIMAGWTAPGAQLVVVRFDPYTSLVFPMLQTLSTSGDRPTPIDLLASSITVCEAALPDAELAVAEHLLLGLAATGTTTLVAAGDHGVAGCWPGDDTPKAAYPASSPWVTSVGGTMLERDGEQITGEAAWSDDADQAAGGGGTSDRLDLPAYQSDAGLTGDLRRYPDVSSLAATDRLNAIPSCSAGICTWQQIGGTSATAPTLAGDLAVALSAARASGGSARLGWMGPLLAGWAADPSGPIVDVTDGSTSLGESACCAAARGWDAATGWGSLRGFDRVAAELAAR